jgi:sec-independent protein translocase protein TatA
MFDIGGPEILFIILIVIVLFGPKKIPEVAQMIGKGMQKIRTAQSQFKEQMDEIQNEMESVNEYEQKQEKGPPIKEINASELNDSHLRREEPEPEENKHPDSQEHGFYPVDSSKQNDSPYDLGNPERDDDNKEDHLDGSTHGFKG